MANPKCKFCGRPLNRKDAFKVVVSGKNHYYCNESEYNIIKKNESDKKQTFILINDIFGYEVINSALFKEVNEISKVYSYEHILGYLKHEEEYLSRVMHTKQFNNEYGSIRYFSAILRNNLKDFKLPEKEEPKNVEVDMPSIQHFSRKKKRRSLCEIEEEV